ncbi:MAG TPA: S-adenosyl-l-methionine hydroxide adenosyltransferase family protein [Chitinophagaceae bacterium]
MKYWFFLLVTMSFSCGKPRPAIVFQTDFGLKDGAVSAMKGVAHEVNPSIPMFDLTHEIPAYNIWEAAYRLDQTVMYWPAGTVFVSVVDPGVGTSRKPVVLKTSTGHYVVSPDNGTLGLLAETLGVAAVREIDTLNNRRKGSEGSHTFHGRDIFAYTAARLASGDIRFEDIGPELNKQVITIRYQKAVLAGDSVKGNIPILDVQYGNVWTNIPDSLIQSAGIQYRDTLSVLISKNDQEIYSGRIPFVRTFGDVNEKQLLGYMNSLGNFSVAINMGSFADTFKVASGPDWTILIRKDKIKPEQP